MQNAHLIGAKVSYVSDEGPEVEGTIIALLTNLDGVSCYVKSASGTVKRVGICALVFSE